MKPFSAVFISDLHLHPQESLITQRFYRFIEWIKQQTDTLYILGDFFHVWPGDDALDTWSLAIAERIASLKKAGLTCYFMPGNRDFLLNKSFQTLTQWQILPDPVCITLENQKILLSHGDRYCTQDKAHQWFRWITRRNSFIKTFTVLPLSLRKKWVQAARQYSQNRTARQSLQTMDVVETILLKEMQQHGACHLIHGHTHRSRQHQYEKDQLYTRYVLSDWDDNPHVLCYDKSSGFKFILFSLS